MILDGKLLSATLAQECASFFSSKNRNPDSYLAIICLGDYTPSLRYVQMKCAFAQRIGVRTVVFGQDQESYSDMECVALVGQCAEDPLCMGILVQLPLPECYSHLHQDLLSLIPPHKDVDGLTGVWRGSSYRLDKSLYPATVRGVIELLHFYQFDNLKGKRIVVIGQSALVGAPLALRCMQQGGEVTSFNIHADQEFLKKTCLEADIIMCATPQAGLVGGDWVRDDKTQIVIDIGWSVVDGTVQGNVKFDEVCSKVHAITPVPGGVGPMTVASVFLNLRDLTLMSLKS